MADSPGTSSSATPPDEDLDVEGKALRLELEKLKLRKQIANEKLNYDGLASRLPAGSSDAAVAGVITVDTDSSALAQAAAQRAVGIVAQRIATEVRREPANSDIASRPLSREPIVITQDDIVFEKAILAAQGSALINRIHSDGEALSVLLANHEWTRAHFEAEMEAIDAEAEALQVPPAPAGSGGGTPHSIAAESAAPGEFMANAAAAASPPAAGTAASTTSGGKDSLATGIELIKLARVDYTTVGSTANRTSDVLRAAAAAALVKGGQKVRIPQLRTSAQLPTQLQEALELRNRMVVKISTLTGAVAMVEAKIAELQATLKQAQSDAASADSSRPVRRAGEITALTIRIAMYKQLMLQPKAELEKSTLLVAQLDTSYASLTAAADGATSLLHAVLTTGWFGTPGLEGGGTVKSVLYVRLDSVTCELLTQKWLMGSSGRVGYQTTATASWMWVRAGAGEVIRAGSESICDFTVWDIQAGSLQANAADLNPANDASLRPFADTRSTKIGEFGLTRWERVVRHGLVTVGGLVVLVAAVAVTVLAIRLAWGMFY